jgi:hypothetical protein
MHGTFERSRKTEETADWSSGLGFVVIPALLAVALIALVIMQPNASLWISQAAQAEFAGVTPVPEAAPARPAQPADRVRAVKAD